MRNSASHSIKSRYRLSELVTHLGGELLGEDVEINQVATLEKANSQEITFVGQAKYAEKVASSAAGAVILKHSHAELTSKPRLIVDNPYLYFAQVATLLNPFERPMPGVHPQAVIANSAKISPSASIGAFVTIEEDVCIEANTVIESGCRIGKKVRIGADCHFYANAVVYADCYIGDRVIIHANAVIGADGFGNVWMETEKQWLKIPQLGAVQIGDDVEIGAATTIDRGALDDTIIGNGVRIDNLVQIAHNVQIGDHTVIAACTGIAGSTRIGSYCTIAGAAMIVGHIDIADNVTVLGGTLVAKSLIHKGVYSGSYPMQKYDAWLQNAARLRHLDSHLDKLAQRLNVLESKLPESKQLES